MKLTFGPVTWSRSDKLKTQTRPLSRTFFVVLGLMIIPVSHANAQTYEQSARYVSPVDESLTIRSISLLPITDNVEGIYARHIADQLTTLMRGSHRWNFIETPEDTNFPSITSLEESPPDFQKATSKLKADSFMTAVASRGPAGLSVRLDLFLKSDGRLLAQQTLRDYKRFEISDLKSQIRRMYGKLLTDIPYDGLILSRQQNRVTINLGKADGIKADQLITAVQIISVQRHPKFGFLISSDKEILGRIKITQVDETLSFGTIISEKERGAIQKLAKISGVVPIQYPDLELVDENGNSLLNQPDAAVAFGDHPREWLPTKSPSFGEVGLRLGLGQFGTNANVDGVPNLEAKDSLFPQLSGHAELWLNSQWTIRADLMNSVITTGNPRSGSSPGKLNQSVSRYALAGQYNFLLKGDYFGPKFFVQSGFAQYKNSADDSQPRAFTSVSYSGLMLGFGGAFPITPDKNWSVSGQLNVFVFPSVSQSPSISDGSPSNNMNEFSVDVRRKIAENLWLVGGLQYSLYMTTFKGASTDNATSISQRLTVLSGGVDWSF